MKGMMMQQSLLISDILNYAADAHGDSEIISVRTEGDLHRQTYRETAARVAQLAHALKAKGIETGDRVATLAWNGYRHFELYYGVSGIGAVVHTINPRLSPEQLIYIVNHASDKMLFTDVTFVPLLEAVKDHLPQGLTYVVMTDRAHMPENTLGALCYEELLQGQPEHIDWPQMDENTAAALCYTSGTTGNPKGALYSHRSTVLHALFVTLVLGAGYPPVSKILPVVPQFHVNAWGLPYAAPLMGHSLVMPGGALDGPSLFKLMDSEKVFSAWGVPTVWQGLMTEIKAQRRKPEGFSEVVVGGSAAPRSMIEGFEKLSVDVVHAWGMTEMSPLGTSNKPLAKHAKLPIADQHKLRENQGRPPYGMDLKIVDDDGNALPHDDTAQGDLLVRGPWVISGYFKPDKVEELRDGWFDTGDVARIDADGYMTICDRSKDIIKSGGEWISSVELENIAVAHPDLLEAAVIGAAHPKWDERPVLVAVKAEGCDPNPDDLIAFFDGKIASWQKPDKVVFTDALPRNATGKVLKRNLREEFGQVLMG